MLSGDRERALLFKNLATLRTDAPLFADVSELEWRVLEILGERPLPTRKEQFFVSQPRAGILFYPDFSQLFR